jgi:Tfp pilus assembly protein PilN
MKPVNIDFAPPGWRRSWHSTPLWSIVALLIALGMSGALSLEVLGQQQQAQDLKDSAQAMSRRLQARVALPPRASVLKPLTAAQAKAINAVIGQLNVPWQPLFDALEEASLPGVALLELHPDAQTNELRAKAEAKSADDMIAYVESLKRQGLFAEVRLDRHEVNEQDRNHPIRFEVSALWREGAL